MADPIMEKKQLEHSEHIEDLDEEKLKQKTGKQDYSGAAEKTDPVEIALVRKLDRWIMVRIRFVVGLMVPLLMPDSLCFGPCTGSTTST